MKEAKIIEARVIHVSEAAQIINAELKMIVVHPDKLREYTSDGMGMLDNDVYRKLFEDGMLTQQQFERAKKIYLALYS